MYHDIRIDIDEQHTECDGNQKQRFKSSGNRQIEEDAGHRYHHQIAPRHIEKRGLMNQVVQCSHNIRHFNDLLCL